MEGIRASESLGIDVCPVFYQELDEFHQVVVPVGGAQDVERAQSIPEILVDIDGFISYQLSERDEILAGDHHMGA